MREGLGPIGAELGLEERSAARHASKFAERQHAQAWLLARKRKKKRPRRSPASAKMRPAAVEGRRLGLRRGLVGRKCGTAWGWRAAAWTAAWSQVLRSGRGVVILGGDVQQSGGTSDYGVELQGAHVRDGVVLQSGGEDGGLRMARSCGAR